ncbi:hypothetical protein ACFLYI_00350 [Chloroflexota bacterium]
MKNGKIKNVLIMSTSATIAFCLQVIGLVRYIQRLPDDWIGISLYSITTIAFAAAAVGFFVSKRQAASVF